MFRVLVFLEAVTGDKTANLEEKKVYRRNCLIIFYEHRHMGYNTKYEVCIVQTTTVSECSVN